MSGVVTAGCASGNQRVSTSNESRGTNDGITTIATHSRMPGSSSRCMRSASDEGPQSVSPKAASWPRVGGVCTRGMNRQPKVVAPCTKPTAVRLTAITAMSASTRRV